MRIPCSAIADSVAPSARICERSNAEVEAAPIPKAPEHANIDLSGLLTEEDIRLYQAASEATPHGKIRPVNPHACRKVYAVLDLLRERFTVEWDPESKGYRKAIRRPR